MTEPGTTSAVRRRGLPDVTTALAMGWVVTTLYGFFSALTSPPGVSIAGWTAVFVTLAVAWSVMERKRWGRLALLGIAGLTCVDALWASRRLIEATPFTTLERMHGMLFPLSSFRAHGGALFVAFLLSLAVGTLFWLLRGTVQGEFEARKRTATRRFQSGIALALIALWSLGGMNFGPARLARSLAAETGSRRIEAASRPEQKESGSALRTIAPSGR